MVLYKLVFNFNFNLTEFSGPFIRLPDYWSNFH